MVVIGNRFIETEPFVPVRRREQFGVRRAGLAIVCREAFVDGLPEFLEVWDLIDVPFEDAKEKLGCNGLILDEKTIIIASGLETPFDAVYQYAGAFRCWHHPLVRGSSL